VINGESYPEKRRSQNAGEYSLSSALPKQFSDAIIHFHQRQVVAATPPLFAPYAFHHSVVNQRAYSDTASPRPAREAALSVTGTLQKKRRRSKANPPTRKVSSHRAGSRLNAHCITFRENTITNSKVTTQCVVDTTPGSASDGKANRPAACTAQYFAFRDAKKLAA